MDEKDRKILDILEENGRASYTEIAEKMDITEATVRNRINSMEKEGTIEGYTVEINESGNVEAFVTVRLSTEKDISEVLNQIPDNIKIYELAGRFDILLNVKGASNSQINEQIDLVRAIEGVKDTETFMVLDEK